MIRGLEFDPEALTQRDLSPDDLWGRPCLAFNVQVDVTDAVADELVSLQLALDKTVPGQYLIPRGALHLSVLNLVHSRSSMSLGNRRELWARNERRWVEAIGLATALVDPFEVRLLHVLPAPAGVLVAATVSAELIALRRQLAAALDMPAEPPELCHVTITRFGPAVPDASELRRALRGLSLDVSLRVSELRTVRESVYPSLERTTVRRHPLASPRHLEGDPHER